MWIWCWTISINVFNKMMFDKKFIKNLENDLEKKINIEETFKKNDLDSLDIFTLLSSFEDFYKIKLKDNDFKLIKNFKELKKKIK
jgi:acyl carrier protein